MAVRIGSIKTRFALSVLVFTLVVIWGGAFVYSRLLREEMVQQLGHQQFSTVSTLADAIQVELTLRVTVLEAVVEGMPPDLAEDPTQAQAHLESKPALRVLFNDRIRLIRPDGSVVAGVPRTPERLAAQDADRADLTRVLKTGQPAVGRPVTGRGSLRPSLSIMVPVRDGQRRVAAVLAGTLELNGSGILDRIASSRYGRSGGYLLVDTLNQTTIVATNPTRAGRPIPAPGRNPLLDRYLQGYEGFGVTENVRGVEELSAARRVPVTGWLLIALLPTAEAFEPIQAMEQRLAWAALGVSLLAGLLAWWGVAALLRREFRPMLATTEAVAGMTAASDAIQPLKGQGKDEIGQLIAAFNRLLATLGAR